MKEYLFNKIIYFASHNQCEENLIGILPPWHKDIDKINPNPPHNVEPDCTIAAFQLNDIWVVVLNVIEILLRIGGIAAVIMIIFGGVQLITSQGNPESVGKARDTITNSVIGLLIIIFANVIISFVVRTIVG